MCFCPLLVAQTAGKQCIILPPKTGVTPGRDALLAREVANNQAVTIQTYSLPKRRDCYNVAKIIANSVKPTKQIIWLTAIDSSKVSFLLSRHWRKSEKRS